MKEIDEQTAAKLEEMVNACNNVMNKIKLVEMSQAVLAMDKPIVSNMSEETRKLYEVTYNRGQEVLTKMRSNYKLMTNLLAPILEYYGAKLAYSETEGKHIIISM